MENRSWENEVNGKAYICSTDPTKVQLEALNDAFHSDQCSWAKRLKVDVLDKMVKNSLCLGLYFQDGTKDGQMVGFTRLVTDYVTYGYVTDVYVLKDHQGGRLAEWVTSNLFEILEGWDDLRKVVLFAAKPHLVKLYSNSLKMQDVREPGVLDKEEVIMRMLGKARRQQKGREKEGEENKD